MLDSKKCLDIYDYCQKQYKKLEKKDGRYSLKHDKTVMELAAKEFRLSEDTVSKAFDLAANVLLKTVVNKKAFKTSLGTM
jgi:hypothetical protein